MIQFIFTAYGASHIINSVTHPSKSHFPYEKKNSLKAWSIPSIFHIYHFKYSCYSSILWNICNSCFITKLQSFHGVNKPEPWKFHTITPSHPLDSLNAWSWVFYLNVLRDLSDNLFNNAMCNWSWLSELIQSLVIFSQNCSGFENLREGQLGIADYKFSPPQSSVMCNGEQHSHIIKAQPSFHNYKVNGRYVENVTKWCHPFFVQALWGLISCSQ